MYCIINENFGIVARLDRRDWKEYMAERMFRSVGEGLEFMFLQSDAKLADIYRCKFSQDTKVVDDLISSSDPGADSHFIERIVKTTWKLWQVKTKNSNANFTQCSHVSTF